MSDIISLDEALSSQTTTGRPVKTFVGYNTGNRTFTVNVTLFEVIELSEVANEQSKNSTIITQRKLDVAHAGSIARYLLKGMLSAAENTRNLQSIELSDPFVRIHKALGSQSYLAIPPLVASLRNAGIGGGNMKVSALKSESGETTCFRIYLDQSDILWIIDGQHRRKAVEMVYDFLKHVLTYHKYPSRGVALLYDGGKEEIGSEELQVWTECLEMLKKCTVAIEVHLGLTPEQERQLFHDLNNLGKKVDKGIALQFDESNPVNSFVKNVIIDDIFDSAGMPPVVEREKGDWDTDGFSRQELVSINALLFLNRTNIHGALPAVIQDKEPTAKRFWNFVTEIKGMTGATSKSVTVAAQPVVLKALAKLIYDFCFGKNTRWRSVENEEKLWHGLETFDFSHSNPIWRYYEMTPAERLEYNISELSEYLPLESEGNRDIGKYEKTSGTFRFGAKHNDIYPIIGDMIRWYLELPSRQK